MLNKSGIDPKDGSKLGYSVFFFLNGNRMGIISGETWRIKLLFCSKTMSKRWHFRKYSYIFVLWYCIFKCTVNVAAAVATYFY